MNGVLKTRKRFVFIGAALTAMTVIGMFSTSSAYAATTPITFAQFVQATPNPDSNQFAYVDNGPTSDAQITTQSGGVNGVSIPVIFTFLAFTGSLPADLRGGQQATLTLTSSTTEAVQTATVFGETLGHQQVFGNGSATDTLTITRDTPAAEGNGGRTDLLTMSFTGSLLGELGDTTPSLTGNTSDGDTVSYSSDFFSIAPTAADDFNMAFSSWATADTGAGLSLSSTAGDAYFASATAAGTATFDSSVTPVVTSVPEPGLGPIVLGSGIVALALRRQRQPRA
jgi:hypothetical protein